MFNLAVLESGLHLLNNGEELNAMMLIAKYNTKLPANEANSDNRLTQAYTWYFKTKAIDKILNIDTLERVY